MKTALFTKRALSMLFSNFKYYPVSYFIEQVGYPNMLLLYVEDCDKTRICFDGEYWGINTTNGCTFSFNVSAEGNLALLEADGYLDNQEVKSVLIHFYENAAFYNKPVLMKKYRNNVTVYKSNGR
jgi:hypothetical protein